MSKRQLATRVPKNQVWKLTLKVNRHRDPQEVLEVKASVITCSSGGPKSAKPAGATEAKASAPSDEGVPARSYEYP